MAYSWLEFKEHNVNYAHLVLLILLFWFWADRIEFDDFEYTTSDAASEQTVMDSAAVLI